MKVKFSKEFSKAMERLSGKLRKSAVAAINEVIDASGIEDITDCKKIVIFALPRAGSRLSTVIFLRFLF